MNRWHIVALSVFVAVVIAATSTSGLRPAFAQDDQGTPAHAPDIDTDTAAPAVHVGDGAATGPRLVCRIFLTDVRHPSVIDTADGTTEVGQWVQERAAEGLVLYGVDFEVGQKATGYPQGYVQVCVYPG